MKKLSLLALFCAFTIASFAQQSIRSEELLGSWKITDVKYSGVNKNAGKCYLCDLHEHSKALVFTPDGKVSYEDNMNPDEVFWKLNGNTLVFSAERVNEVSGPEGALKPQKPANTVMKVELKASMNNGVLTLVFQNGDVTETYTLTK
ncbi:MAG: lipocalin family protein [Chitinophagales bacterium]